MLDLIRRFTIRTRMLGAIAMVVALLAMVGGAGLWGIARVTEGAAAFIGSTHADVVLLADMGVALGNVRRYEKDQLIHAGKAAQVQAYRLMWQAALDLVRDRSRKMAATGSPADIESLKAFDGLMSDYADAALSVFKALEAGSLPDLGSANQALDPAKKSIHAAEQQLKRLQAMQQDETRQAGIDQQQIARQAGLLFAGALAAAVLLVVPLTLANMVSICRPLDQARRLAERIATGDLTALPDTRGADEPARLLVALDAMQASLHSIVGQVRGSAESIQVASAEVASGNTDLSQRTEQAASSLQQTASALQQLTGNVQQSAAAASQAKQLAASASAVAQRGGAVVGQVVSTMDEINQSSRRIADIIGTIDGIAFQTNILALNAAVEAARAGEQGRGFAVVASEVRSLAQRSAQAAAEIKGLIGSSVGKVEAGARLVQGAGETMAEIVASVQRVSDVIGEITAAASEQSGGIGQVNGAVHQLDQMTQQNAALVEQSAAAAQSLRDQAARMSQVVSQFQLKAAQRSALA